VIELKGKFLGSPEDEPLKRRINPAPLKKANQSKDWDAKPTMLRISYPGDPGRSGYHRRYQQITRCDRPISRGVPKRPSLQSEGLAHKDVSWAFHF